MFETYADALAWLYAYADFERGAGLGGGPPFEQGLERTSRLLDDLGDPHHDLPIVHVAGSKGKGSVCALVASAAEAAGLRTGLYTQPHLHTFRERFQIDGEPIDPVPFARLVARARGAVKRTRSATRGDPTTFEISTAMALAWFRMQNVDLAILEVGLGGRLDATNVVTPDVTAVSTIVREHMRLLGDTLPEIAREKAAIAKPGVPMLVSDQSTEVLKAIRDVAVAASADVQVVPALATDGTAAWRHGRATTIARDPHSDDTLPLGLAGPHQARNAGLAYAICSGAWRPWRRSPARRDSRGLRRRALAGPVGTGSQRSAGYRGRSAHGRSRYGRGGYAPLATQPASRPGHLRRPARQIGATHGRGAPAIRDTTSWSSNRDTHARMPTGEVLRSA